MTIPEIERQMGAIDARLNHHDIISYKVRSLLIEAFEAVERTSDITEIHRLVRCALDEMKKLIH